MKEVKYKLKKNVPDLFIFLHCEDGDFDFSNYQNLLTAELEVSRLVADGEFLCDCELRSYTRFDAKKLLDRHEAWFCATDYVDEL